MDAPYLFLWGVKLCQGTTSPQFNKTLRRKEFAKNYDFMIDPSQRCLPQMGLCQNKRKTIWPKKGVAKIHPFFERTYSEMIYGLFANCETKHLFIHFIRPFMNTILFSDLFSPQVNKTKPRYYLTKRKKYIVSRVVSHEPFAHVFTAVQCVFKEITLVVKPWHQRRYLLKNALHCGKCMGI